MQTSTAETQRRLCAMTGLSPIGEEDDFGQMVSIPVPSMDADVLKDTLFERHRIEVPVTSHGDRLFVRLCVQGYNTQEDMDTLVEAVREIYGLA